MNLNLVLDKVNTFPFTKCASFYCFDACHKIMRHNILLSGASVFTNHIHVHRAILTVS